MAVKCTDPKCRAVFGEPHSKDCDYDHTPNPPREKDRDKYEGKGKK